MTISTDSHDQSSAPGSGGRSVWLLRAHAQDGAGVARHDHGHLDDASGAQTGRGVDALRLRERLRGLPRRRRVRLGDVQQDDRPRFRSDDPGHARQAASRSSKPGFQGIPPKLARAVGTRGDRSDLRPAGRRDQERRRGRSRQGDHVRVPHPGHRRPARLAAGGPGSIPAVVARSDFDHRWTSRPV